MPPPNSLAAMEAILGSLFCLVLFAAECFAIKSGLPYPGNTNIVGPFAGVLQPAFDPTDPFSSNSLGVFTLGVPTQPPRRGRSLPCNVTAVGRRFSNRLRITNGRADGRIAETKNLVPN